MKKIQNLKFKIQKSTRGFTLIELMIVITVIAILSAIGLFAFTRVQRGARDSERKAEMKTLQQALIAFNGDVGRYPTLAEGLACLIGTGAAPCTRAYLNAVPTPPLGATAPPAIAAYTYTAGAAGTGTYGICVGLEQPNTADFMWTIGGANSGGLEVAEAAACPTN